MALSSEDTGEIVSADDACPICRRPIMAKGEFMGIWDGSLGDGAGNWYRMACDACGAELIGWEYSTPGDPVTRIRWDARRPGLASHPHVKQISRE